VTERLTVAMVWTDQGVTVRRDLRVDVVVNSEFVPLEQQFPSEPLASDPSVPRLAAAATAG
jgi:hypothetical protein